MKSKPDATAGLLLLAKQAVFTVGQAAYSGADVILAAQCWRDWGDLEKEAREGIACVKYAAASRQEAAQEEVEAAADAFRSERDLLAAVDAQNWLGQRQVTPAAWMKYIHRSMLRRKWRAQLSSLMAHYPVSQERLNRNIRVVGMCSGHFARFARKLAGHAAIHERINQQSAGGGELQGHSGVVTSSFALDEQAAQLLDLAPSELAKRLRRIADLEHSFLQFRALVLTPAVVQAQVSSRHIDWIRIESCTLSFPEEPAAREAALCVRQDAEGLDAVATRTKIAVRQESLYLEDLERDLQPAFLSACSGDLVGPIPAGAEFKIYLIVNKVMPTAQDSDVRSKAEQLLLQKALNSEVQARVHWQVDWWPD